jgi:hypothetical protein
MPPPRGEGMNATAYTGMSTTRGIFTGARAGQTTPLQAETSFARDRIDQKSGNSNDLLLLFRRHNDAPGGVAVKDLRPATPIGPRADP